MDPCPFVRLARAAPALKAPISIALDPPQSVVASLIEVLTLDSAAPGTAACKLSPHLRLTHAWATNNKQGEAILAWSPGHSYPLNDAGGVFALPSFKFAISSCMVHNYAHMHTLGSSGHIPRLRTHAQAPSDTYTHMHTLGHCCRSLRRMYDHIVVESPSLPPVSACKL